MSIGGWHWRARWLVVALLLAVTALAAFWPVMDAAFVNYDDPEYVTANDVVRRGLTAEGVRWAFSATRTGNWHPVTWLSHLLDVEWYGQRPRGHHLTSLGIHAANGLLVALLLRSLAGWAAWPAGLAAALFLAHPLRVESVAWISERKDVLSGFFFLLTLLAWTRYARNEKRGHDPISGTSEMGIVSPGNFSMAPVCPSLNSQGHDPQFHETGNGVMSRNCRGIDLMSRIFRRIRVNSQGHDPDFKCQIGSCPGIPYYVLSLVLFALGLMAKPMLVTLPFLLLLLDWWPLGRFAQAGRFPGFIALRRAGWLALEKLPFLAMAAASAVVAYRAQAGSGAVMTHYATGSRVANALTALVDYLRMTIWPSKLAVFYPHPSVIAAWRVAASVAVLAALAALAAALWRRFPALAVGMSWFAGMLVPVLGLVQVGDQASADRYTYLPGIGLVLILPGLVALTGRLLGRPARLLLPVASAILVVVLVFLASRQSSFWANSGTLFERALAVTEGNYVAHVNLGNYLSAQGRTDEALGHFEQALRLKPMVLEPYNNIGTLLMRQGRKEEAERWFERVLALKNDFAPAHYNLGLLQVTQGRFTEGLAHLELVLRQFPDSAEALSAAGVALARLGRLPEAIDAYRRAVAVRPDDADARYNLGVALDESGRRLEAALEYERAAVLRPGYAEALNNLGVLRAADGRLEDAVSLYRAAIRSRPGHAGAHNNLGVALRRQGSMRDAAASFREALRLRPDFLEARANLESLAREAGQAP